jgi:myo-inositol-1(or 4)-monophosphatase
LDNFSWFNAFKEMGLRVREAAQEIIGDNRAGEPLGEGASGDITFAVDKRAENAIITVLEEARRAGESFTFISEELGEKDYGNRDVVIIADPIDGSNNAKFGMPYYSTSIALAVGRNLSDVVLGYVMNLATGDEFWAMKGQGAYKNGIRIKPREEHPTRMVNFECSDPSCHLPGAMALLTIFDKVRWLGSTALDLAYLASGSTDAVYVATASRSFDYAAGWLLVEESGGVITDTTGKPLDGTPLGIVRTRPILAAATPELHKEALAAVGVD